MKCVISSSLHSSVGNKILDFYEGADKGPDFVGHIHLPEENKFHRSVEAMICLLSNSSQQSAGWPLAPHVMIGKQAVG